MLRASGAVAISGNHDRAALGRIDSATFGRAARLALEWTRARLTDESREYLASLPSTDLVDEKFYIVHGALHPEPNDQLHLSTAPRVARSFEELATGRFGSNICFFGHTHRPVIYEYRAKQVRTVEETDAMLLPDAHYLVNPGSVGQSRDGDWRAAYAIFDAELRRVELRRVAYDMARSECDTRAEGLSDVESWPARSLAWLERRIDTGRDVIATCRLAKRIRNSRSP
jgi:diadenosine tetraphosphatase ApaH/serine/threonine PP2A family protein phosphatase